MNSHWTTAQPPVSVPYIFGVRCTKQPSSASFVATPAVAGAARSMSASICPIAWNAGGQPIEWLAYTSATTGDLSALNQTWHVVCTLTTWVPPTGPPPWPNQWVEETVTGDIMVKNLEITSGSIGASPSDPLIGVVDDEPFVAIDGSGTALWLESTDDGTELPAAQTALGQFDLLPLAAGHSFEAEATGVPPTLFQCEVEVPWDGAGLYYRRFLVGESGQGYPQSSDGTGSLSGISVTDIRPYQFDVVAPRVVVAGMRITVDGPVGSPLADAKHRWCSPGGELHGGGGVPPETAGSTTDVLLSVQSMPRAGTWAFAATYKDSLGDHYHEGTGKWLRPGVWSFTVPSAIAFVGASHCVVPDLDPAWYYERGRAANAYEQLGEVRTGPDAPISFYSVRHDVAGLGDDWVVLGGTKWDIMEALGEDQVVYYGGHGNVGFIEIRSGSTNWLLTDDVAGYPLPGGTPCRLFWSNSCYGYNTGAAPGSAGDNTTSTDSLCGAVLARGVSCVVGYRDSVVVGYSSELENPAWHLMTKQGYTVGGAVNKAVGDLMATHGQQWMAETGVGSVRLGGDPNTMLAPAFAVTCEE